MLYLEIWVVASSSICDGSVRCHTAVITVIIVLVQCSPQRKHSSNLLSAPALAPAPAPLPTLSNTSTSTAAITMSVERLKAVPAAVESSATKNLDYDARQDLLQARPGVQSCQHLTCVTLLSPTLLTCRALGTRLCRGPASGTLA